MFEAKNTTHITSPCGITQTIFVKTVKISQKLSQKDQNFQLVMKQANLSAVIPRESQFIQDNSNPVAAVKERTHY